MKKNYEDEIINTKANIFIGFLNVLSLYSLYGTFKQFTHGDFGCGIFILTVGILLAFFLCCIFIIYSNIHNAMVNNKITKEIIENGIKVQGKIIKIITKKNRDKENSYFKRSTYFRKHSFLSTHDGTAIEYYYYAIVKYAYNGKEYKIKSPSLQFHHSYLTSKNVDVYLYEDKYYIDNYKIDYSKIKHNENYNMKMKKTIMLLFLITFILCFIAIYLSIINILDVKLSIMLCIFFMFIYFIIALIIYLKYILK